MRKNSVGLYVLGKKGLAVLARICSQFSPTCVAYVYCAADKSIQNDYYQEIIDYCQKNNIDAYTRGSAEMPPSAHECEYKFSVGWRWMIQDAINLIVFHDSLLPRYRGFAPLVNMLIAGEDKIGVTALFASQKYDRGDIIAQAERPIKYPLSIEEAIEKIIPIYCELAVDILTKIFTQSYIVGTTQNESHATYSLWRDDEDYNIFWSDSADAIGRFCDAVGFPYKGAQSNINGVSFTIAKVTFYGEEQIERRKNNIGKVVFMEDNLPIIVCGEGLLKIDKYIHNLTGDENPALPFRSRFG